MFKKESPPLIVFNSQLSHQPKKPNKKDHETHPKLKTTTTTTKLRKKNQQRKKQQHQDMEVFYKNYKLCKLSSYQNTELRFQI